MTSYDNLIFHIIASIFPILRAIFGEIVINKTWQIVSNVWYRFFDISIAIVLELVLEMCHNNTIWEMTTLDEID